MSSIGNDRNVKIKYFNSSPSTLFSACYCGKSNINWFAFSYRILERKKEAGISSKLSDLGG